MGLESHVGQVLALLAQRPARLNGTQLLCVDGPAGSGKTTLAEAVVTAAEDAHLIHLDLLLDGWDGLGGVAETLAHDVLEPLRAGLPASFQRYDWHARRFAERVSVPPHALLVVEGVGAGSRATAPFRSASVWVEAPDDVRHDRAMGRDGEVFAPHWKSWAAEEKRHFAAERTRARADLIVETYS